jgi:hypothetical protein
MHLNAHAHTIRSAWLALPRMWTSVPRLFGYVRNEKRARAKISAVHKGHSSLQQKSLTARNSTTRSFRYVFLLIAASIALGACGVALAQTLGKTPEAAPAAPVSGPTRRAALKIEMTPSLLVMSARGARLEGNTLTLEGISPQSIVFADRPVRAAGHALTKHLLEEWAPGGSFAKDPPNATVSVLSKEGESVRDVVVEMTSPRLDGDQLSFNVRVLEGDLVGGDGPASVFIDIIGMPFTPMSIAGVARRTARRAYWYGGAAAPYYANPYGYPYAAPYPYGSPYPVANPYYPPY